MQIVIDIPEEEYKCVQITGYIGNATQVSNAILNGTPLPKGRWIHYKPDFMLWKCSNCGAVIFSETEEDRLEFHGFCGRCGAKMEAEDEIM